MSVVKQQRVGDSFTYGCIKGQEEQETSSWNRKIDKTDLLLFCGGFDVPKPPKQKACLLFLRDDERRNTMQTCRLAAETKSIRGFMSVS